MRNDATTSETLEPGSRASPVATKRATGRANQVRVAGPEPDSAVPDAPHSPLTCRPNQVQAFAVSGPKLSNLVRAQGVWRSGSSPAARIRFGSLVLNLIRRYPTRRRAGDSILRQRPGSKPEPGSRQLAFFFWGDRHWPRLAMTGRACGVQWRLKVGNPDLAGPGRPSWLEPQLPRRSRLLVEQ
jgi:hypothetical protein